MIGEYTDLELNSLHEILYSILDEFHRVCEVLNIPYFIIGGTAIGAFYDKAILPWDDDIDVGLTRENYERLLKEAPAVISDRFFLQWIGSDQHTPYYFAKLMLKNSLFVDEYNQKLDVQKGIYIDIFPFDRVPDNLYSQTIHRIWCNFLNCAFISKEVWQWKWIKTPDIKSVKKRNIIMCFLTWLMICLFSKQRIYKWLSSSLSFYNNRKTSFYNMVLMKRDHISDASIKHPQLVQFGNLTIWAPNDLETYLNHHYINLTRNVPKEEQKNHRPIELHF